MPTVYIPALLESLAGGRSSLEVKGRTVREVIDNLERACPGIRARLIERARLRPNIRVAVDGRLTPRGLVARVSPTSEIHFVAAVGGG